MVAWYHSNQCFTGLRHHRSAFPQAGGVDVMVQNGGSVLKCVQQPRKKGRAQLFNALYLSALRLELAIDCSVMLLAEYVKSCCIVQCKQPAFAMKSAKSFAFALQQNEVQLLRFRHPAPSCSSSQAVALFAKKTCKKRVPALRFRKKALRSNLMLTEER